MRVLLLLALLAGPWSVAAQSLTQRLAEVQRGTRLEAALADHALLGRFALTARVSGDQATLEGVVVTEEERQAAAQVAATQPGIGRVSNQIRLRSEGDRPAADSTAAPPPAADSLDTDGDGEMDAELRGGPPMSNDPVAAPATPPPAARPAPAREAPRARATYHTVRRGDTLSSIARRYDTSMAEIRRLNNMRTSTVRLGQRLRVR